MNFEGIKEWLNSPVDDPVEILTGLGIGGVLIVAAIGGLHVMHEMNKRP